MQPVSHIMMNRYNNRVPHAPLTTCSDRAHIRNTNSCAEWTVQSSRKRKQRKNKKTKQREIQENNGKQRKHKVRDDYGANCFLSKMERERESRSRSDEHVHNKQGQNCDRKHKYAERSGVTDVRRLRCAVSHSLSANKFFDLICRSGHIQHCQNLTVIAHSKPVADR